MGDWARISANFDFGWVHRGPKSKSAKSIANLLESLQSSLETSNLLHEGEEGIFFS